MTVVDITARTGHTGSTTCAACHRTLERDWVLFTGRRWMCGQCLSSEAYDVGFREACRRLGADVTTAITARPETT